ncbi:hypothetical protein ABZ845_02420 [Streptomyces sp. NPDC047022]|uniref:hypothetical protein n=1 Tax=Streptomyces sp. NPDC047022 TaxID=3155737 RepID=UPI0033FB647F
MAWRSMRVGTAAVAGVLLAGAVAVPAHANTPVGCSDLALIQAINDSNGGLNDHILDLTPYCVYTLTDADGTLPTITQALMIHGHNATIRRDPNAANAFRIFEVGGTSLTMDTLTVMNGSDAGGGGVFLNTSGGSLITTDVNFQGNHSSLEGGAIDSTDTAVGNTISLTGGTVSDNSADQEGGGIEGRSDVAVTLTSVTLTRNRAEVRGGAVSMDSSTGPLNITGSTISHNTARRYGGGISHFGNTGGGSATISGSTISDNRVIQSTAGGGGIGVYESALSVPVTITGSTISGNLVTGFIVVNDIDNAGGGIQQQGGSLTLDSTNVTGNRLVGQGGHGGGIVVTGDIAPSLLTLQNNTNVTGNLASGRYAQGGGLFFHGISNILSVVINGSHVDGNKVTGTGSSVGGVYNVDAAVSFNGSTVNNNIAPSAPAPGGVSTVTVPITSVTSTVITGNTPTNCLLSPQPVTGCVG